MGITVSHAPDTALYGRIGYAAGLEELRQRRAAERQQRLQNIIGVSNAVRSWMPHVGTRSGGGGGGSAGGARAGGAQAAQGWGPEWFGGQPVAMTDPRTGKRIEMVGVPPPREGMGSEAPGEIAPPTYETTPSGQWAGPPGGLMPQISAEMYESLAPSQRADLERYQRALGDIAKTDTFTPEQKAQFVNKIQGQIMDTLAMPGLSVGKKYPPGRGPGEYWIDDKVGAMVSLDKEGNPRVLLKPDELHPEIALQKEERDHRERLEEGKRKLYLQLAKDMTTVDENGKQVVPTPQAIMGAMMQMESALSGKLPASGSGVPPSAEAGTNMAMAAIGDPRAQARGAPGALSPPAASFADEVRARMARMAGAQEAGGGTYPPAQAAMMGRGAEQPPSASQAGPKITHASLAPVAPLAVEQIADVETGEQQLEVALRALKKAQAQSPGAEHPGSDISGIRSHWKRGENTKWQAQVRAALERVKQVEQRVQVLNTLQQRQTAQQIVRRAGGVR